MSKNGNRSREREQRDHRQPDEENSITKSNLLIGDLLSSIHSDNPPEVEPLVEQLDNFLDTRREEKYEDVETYNLMAGIVSLRIQKEMDITGVNLNDDHPLVQLKSKYERIRDRLKNE